MKVVKIIYYAFIAVFMINGGCSYSKNSASGKQSYNSSHLLLALTHLSNTMEHTTVSVGEQLSDWNLNAPLMKAIFGKYPTFRENIIELKKKG